MPVDVFTFAVLSIWAVCGATAVYGTMRMCSMPKKDPKIQPGAGVYVEMSNYLRKPMRSECGKSS